LSVLHELKRKWLHFASAAIPLSIEFRIIPENLFLVFLGIICVGMFCIEMIRLRTNWGKIIFQKYFGVMLREHEKIRFTAAFYQTIAFFLCYLLMPLSIATLACLLLCFSDGIAALAGIAWGKPWIYGKTKIGTGSFFTSGILVNLIFGLVDFRVGLAGVIAGTIAELLPSRFNDNFSVPMMSGAVMTIFAYLIRV